MGWFPNPKGSYSEFSNSILPKSSPETDLPALYQEPLQTSKYGQKWARVERDDYVSWENIVF